jgi:hypothetical protein
VRLEHEFGCLHTYNNNRSRLLCVIALISAYYRFKLTQDLRENDVPLMKAANRHLRHLELGNKVTGNLGLSFQSSYLYLMSMWRRVVESSEKSVCGWVRFVVGVLRPSQADRR